MYKIWTLARASWLAAASYRVQHLISVVSILAGVIPLYFVANALQPVMAESIEAQGGHYFGFVLVGIIAFLFLGMALDSLPSAVGSGIASGTLEIQLSTATSLPTLLAGLVSYGFLYQTARSILMLVAGTILGAQFVWSQLLVGVGILLLIIAAYLPFGILAAALILVFRTAGPMNRGIILLSGLLGGVYYPTHVIPSWIQLISDFIPLTYGLRALRRTVLDGAPLGAVAGDLTVLSGFAVVLLSLSTLAFAAAMRYAKKAGSLSHY